MRRELEEHVWRRACRCCEYCWFPTECSAIGFEIDHIIAQKHGGPTQSANLALACFYCNSYKGPCIAGIDPVTGQVTRLFHPRNDQWDEHFRWDGPVLQPLTDVARATINVLRINDADAVEVRASLIEEGVFPPRVDK